MALHTRGIYPRNVPTRRYSPRSEKLSRPTSIATSGRQRTRLHLRESVRSAAMTSEIVSPRASSSQAVPAPLASPVAAPNQILPLANKNSPRRGHSPCPLFRRLPWLLQAVRPRQDEASQVHPGKRLAPANLALTQIDSA